LHYWGTMFSPFVLEASVGPLSLDSVTTPFLDLEALRCLLPAAHVPMSMSTFAPVGASNNSRKLAALLEASTKGHRIDQLLRKAEQIKKTQQRLSVKQLRSLTPRSKEKNVSIEPLSARCFSAPSGEYEKLATALDVQPSRKCKAFETDDSVSLEAFLSQGENERRRHAWEEQNRRENKIRVDQDNHMNTTLCIDLDELKMNNE
jgi:hypothetical protein